MVVTSVNRHGQRSAAKIDPVTAGAEVGQEYVCIFLRECRTVRGYKKIELVHVKFRGEGLSRKVPHLISSQRLAHILVGDKHAVDGRKPIFGEHRNAVPFLGRDLDDRTSGNHGKDAKRNKS